MWPRSKAFGELKIKSKANSNYSTSEVCLKSGHNTPRHGPNDCGVRQKPASNLYHIKILCNKCFVRIKCG